MCKRKNILNYYKHVVDFYLDFVWRHVLVRHTFYMWITSVLRWIEHYQLKTIIFRAKQTAQDEGAEKSSGLKRKQVPSSFLTPSNWHMKFTNDEGSIVLLITFIISIMVGSCAAYGCTNRK